MAQVRVRVVRQGGGRGLREIGMAQVRVKGCYGG